MKTHIYTRQSTSLLRRSYSFRLLHNTSLGHLLAALRDFPVSVTLYDDVYTVLPSTSINCHTNTLKGPICKSHLSQSVQSLLARISGLGICNACVCWVVCPSSHFDSSLTTISDKLCMVPLLFLSSDWRHAFLDFLINQYREGLVGMSAKHQLALGFPAGASSCLLVLPKQRQLICCLG